ncbi:MAG: lycopene beta-cyclase CrtY [Candidatus Andeanibacterium colombiense]|uniref:Lycopene beta-cyclase CrtY n=1 Tax=Candidatus Andeanibacterium colombiense TaxID=3121345 RepID=A0AAJ6BQ81_9SPHN|nr:MAG: lycopene beta-cyclase CrtY [Sphingomonadaceae bacterium]
MDGGKVDIAIIGGGLAGGLIAAALARHRPEVSIALVEAGGTLGGNHRWSWFASDIQPEGAELLGAFPHTAWDEGYDVRFPGLTRTLPTPYCSLGSADFDAGLRALLPEGTIYTATRALVLDDNEITLEGGERLAAKAVIDCRGQGPSPHLTGGWQVFYGRHMRTAEPHGLTRPVIMDATVEQYAAYRFVYVLPLGPDEIFVEDTYYTDSPELDRDALAGRVSAYCARHGWAGETLGEETGVLPVVDGGSFGGFTGEHRAPGVARAGARGGFFHPLTSYSLPQAVETALAIAHSLDLGGPAIVVLLEERAEAHWRKTGFYRMLARMLFGAAVPGERWKIFARFYGLNGPLIERFYAANSSLADKLRILLGKPPVPLGKAFGALFSEGRPLEIVHDPEEVA